LRSWCVSSSQLLLPARQASESKLKLFCPKGLLCIGTVSLSSLPLSPMWLLFSSHCEGSCPFLP
jgi:hypothetical protein